MMNPLYSLELGLLSHNLREKMTRDHFDKSLWLFFKPNCSVCYSQVKELTCLKDDIKKFAVGFNGSRKELWRESKKIKLNQLSFSKIYRADEKTINHFSLKKNLSPQILLFINQKAVKYYLGLTKCQDIKNSFLKNKVVSK